MVTVGTDIIEVDRIKRAMQRTSKFREKIFTSTEIEYCSNKANPEQHFAGRFAAKEALKKAIMSMHPDMETIPFRIFEIINAPNGKPEVKILENSHYQLNENYTLEVSISHIKNLAMATAIMEKL
ncbi:MAG TPA: holo-ACP synthase [bacterium]|nr:holo-ACP synthase [bacterium]